MQSALVTGIHDYLISLRKLVSSHPEFALARFVFDDCA